MNLKAYRKSINITQAAAADELEITVVYFSELEREVTRPSPKLAMKIEAWAGGQVNRADLRPDLWKAS